MVNIPRLSLGNRRVKRNSLSTTTKRVLLLFLVMLMIVGLALPLVKISKVQIKGQPSCASADQLKNGAQLNNQSWFFFDAGRVKKRLLEQFPCLADVNLVRLLPEAVVIEVVERQPILVVEPVQQTSLTDLVQLEATPSSSAAQLTPTSPSSPSASFLVDRLGVIFSQDLSRASSLPHVWVVGSQLSLGQTMKGEMVNKMVTILKKLQQLQLPVDQAKQVDQLLLVSGQTQLIFSLEKDERVQLASLQLILQKAKIDSKPIDRIDLRFDKPVVVYSSVKKTE